MPHRMEDGAALDDDQWHANIDALLDQWKPEPRPEFTPGLRLPVHEDAQRVILCAGPHFALERWQVTAGAVLEHPFRTALLVSNAGAPVSVRVANGAVVLSRAMAPEPWPPPETGDPRRPQGDRSAGQSSASRNQRTLLHEGDALLTPAP